jgi:hypothetical protein
MKKFDYKLFLLALLLPAMHACVGMKTSSGGGSSPSLVKMYNKGKDSLLCHAGPVEYQGVNSKDELELDYTYLKVKGHSNDVVCNFSLITSDATLRPDKVTVEVNGEKTTVSDLEKFFAEGYGKKQYKYRYSFKISDTLYYHLMKSERPLITVNDRVFSGGRDHRKKSNTIFRAILFDLYN